jgi:hypothetical protein
VYTHATLHDAQMLLRWSLLAYIKARPGSDRIRNAMDRVATAVLCERNSCVLAAAAAA